MNNKLAPARGILIGSGIGLILWIIFFSLVIP